MMYICFYQVSLICHPDSQIQNKINQIDQKNQKQINFPSLKTIKEMLLYQKNYQIHYKKNKVRSNRYQINKLLQKLMKESNKNDNKIGFSIGDYSCVQLLGVGGFGEVQKAIHMETQQVFALKIIDKDRISQEKSLRIREIRKRLLKSESEIMMKCNSEHVVKFYKRFENPQDIVFVLEYCNQKDLKAQIAAKPQKKIPQSQAIKILKQIIKGFAELHKHNIIHRDLKPDNIFKHNQIYKIGDLGFAKILPNLIEMSEGTTLGTLTTMAPEIMKEGKYGVKADLWSLGMIYYEMLYGYPPIKFKSRQQMINDFRNKIPFPYNQNCSNQSVELLERMLVPDPQQRMSWSQLYQHPILNRVQKSEIFVEDYKANVSLEESKLIHLDPKYQNQVFLIEPQLQSSIDILVFESAAFVKVPSQSFENQQNAMKELQKIQIQILSYIEQLSFHKLRSQLILDNLIEELLKLKPKTNKRLFYEFLFLLITRCFFIISPIHDALQKRKNTFNWPYYIQLLESSTSVNFLRQFKQHYDLIIKKKNYIQENLFKQQSKLKEVVSDFFIKIFKSQQYAEKEKFCVGIQSQDYKMEQHIEFTIENYPKIIFNEIEGNLKNSEEKKQIQRAKKFLGQYALINKAKFKKDNEYIKKISIEFAI